MTFPGKFPQSIKVEMEPRDTMGDKAKIKASEDTTISTAEKEDATEITAINTTATAMTGVKSMIEGKCNKEAPSFRETIKDLLGLPYHEVNFMTGKELRDRGDRMILEAYVKSNTTSDQCYSNWRGNKNTKRRIVKPIKKWSGTNKPVHQVGVFKFEIDSNIKSHKTGNRGLFVFGTSAISGKEENYRKLTNQMEDFRPSSQENKDQGTKSLPSRRKKR